MQFSLTKTITSSSIYSHCHSLSVTSEPATTTRLQQKRKATRLLSSVSAT